MTTTPRARWPRRRDYLPDAPVGYLPSRGAIYGSGLEPAPHLVGERHRALDVLAAAGWWRCPPTR